MENETHTGLKFNWTVKENAVKELMQEEAEKQSIAKTKQDLNDLGIEVL